MGRVSARDNWVTHHSQKQKNKAQREKLQKRNQAIAEVRRFNHQQDIAAALHAPTFVVKGPFDSFAGGAYLNAIYHGDFALVKQADKDYATSLRKLYDLATNNNPGFLGSIVRQAFSAVTIHDSITAKYLFNYEQRFGTCLKEDAETFGVEERVPGLVATNMLGVELWRTNGFSNIYTYNVNKEFAPAFRKVGAMNPEALAFVNNLLSSGLPDYRMQTVAGAKQIQSRFACDDAIVRQFEANLRRLYQ